MEEQLGESARKFRQVLGFLGPWKKMWASHCDVCIGATGISAEHKYSFVHFI